jgi:DNA-binding MarR family transcriptional regulator
MMTNKEVLMEKLYKMMSLLLWEMETAWDYGAGFPIRHSEVHLLDTIKEHEGAKASEIAGYLGLTNGAISQGTKKLLDKGLVEDYKLPNNRKEVFFRLTPLGEKVYRGHKEHHGKMDIGFSQYRAGLSEKDLQVICNFFDAATQSIEKIKDK